MIPIQLIKNKFEFSKRYVYGTPLKTKWLYLRRIGMRRFRPYIPLQLWIGITYNCQCKCVHCFLGPKINKNVPELDGHKIRGYIETARKLGFMEISFFGGEPLLRKDLPELIKFASSKGLLTNVFTNGVLLDEQMTRELREAGLNQCNVSLDSASPELHDKRRNLKGCFDKAIGGMKNVLHQGMKCEIWTYVKKEDIQHGNLKDLSEIVAIGRDTGVHEVFVLFPCASGNWLCSTQNILTREERERVRAFAEKHSAPPIVRLEFPREESTCKAGSNFVYISPSGSLTPCPAVPYRFGNIEQEQLGSVLKNIDISLLSSQKQGGECIMNNMTFRKKIGLDTLTDSEKHEVSKYSSLHIK